VFLGLCLDALDEELVTLRSSISTPKLASTLKIEGLEEEAPSQSGEGQTEVRERDYSVRQFFFSVLSLALLTYRWTRIGKFSRVAHLAHILWKISLNCTRTKPA